MWAEYLTKLIVDCPFLDQAPNDPRSACQSYENAKMRHKIETVEERNKLC